mmetsp:Transcript_15448/g.26565  ORF Transcript_15448/g.26565 Transcript_15448/m.26565 type:complete len:114 (+) Transcript_15448:794-1135(+)
MWKVSVSFLVSAAISVVFVNMFSLFVFFNVSPTWRCKNASGSRHCFLVPRHLFFLAHVVYREGHELELPSDSNSSRVTFSNLFSDVAQPGTSSSSAFECYVSEVVMLKIFVKR